MRIVIIIILSILLFLTLETVILRKKGINPKELITDKLKSKKGIDNWIIRKQIKLNKSGADFFVKDGISVMQWYLFKVLLAGLTYLIFYVVTSLMDLALAYLISLAGFLLGYFLLDIYIYLANKKSNDEMMADIMEMSRSVLYGARGGQFISDALSDAVLVVENKRLKKAMIKMKMGLAAKEPIDACLKNLEEHFNNAEISAFITVIKSLMQTGQLDEALKTLESNITREQSGVNKRRLVILENRTMAYVMIVAFDILGLMLYCIIMKVLDLQIAL